MPPVPALPAPGVKQATKPIRRPSCRTDKNRLAICVRCFLSTNIIVQYPQVQFEYLGQICNGGLVSNRSNRFQSLANKPLAWVLQSEIPFLHVLELEMAIGTGLVRAIMASTL